MSFLLYLTRPSLTNKEFTYHSLTTCIPVTVFFPLGVWLCLKQKQTNKKKKNKKKKNRHFQSRSKGLYHLCLLDGSSMCTISNSYFWSIKVILLFRYSIFCVLQCPLVKSDSRHALIKTSTFRRQRVNQMFTLHIILGEPKMI